MKKTITKYPTLILLSLSLILRVPLLGGSFWMDEAAQALEVVRPLSQQLDIISDFQPPLLHLVLHFAQYFSKSEWFLRTIGALIPGLITIFFTYRLGTKLYSQKAGFIAGLLLATSSFHIYFSQELRPYSLPAMFALISMYYFYTALQQRKHLIFLTISNALGLYTSYLYPFFMIAQLAYVLYSFKKIKAFFSSFFVSGVAFIPFAPIFLQQLLEGMNVKEKLPGWEFVVSTPQLKALPMVFGKLLFGMLPLDFNFLLIFLSGSMLILSLLIVYKTKLYTQLKQHSFVLFWIFIPVLTAWLISFVVPVLSPKRVLFILPALYIFIAAMSTQEYKNYSAKRLLNLFLLLIFTINTIGTFSYYTNQNLQRENWKELHTHLYTTFSITDTLLVYSFPEPFAPMRWYDQAKPQTINALTTNALYIEDVPDLNNTLKVATQYSSVLVFDYLRDLSDPNKKIDTVLLELGFIEVGVLDYPNIGFVRIFMQPQQLIGMEQP